MECESFVYDKSSGEYIEIESVNKNAEFCSRNTDRISNILIFMVNSGKINLEIIIKMSDY